MKAQPKSQPVRIPGPLVEQVKRMVAEFHLQQAAEKLAALEQKSA